MKNTTEIVAMIAASFFHSFTLLAFLEFPLLTRGCIASKVLKSSELLLRWEEEDIKTNERDYGTKWM